MDDDKAQRQLHRMYGSQPSDADLRGQINRRRENGESDGRLAGWEDLESGFGPLPDQSKWILKPPVGTSTSGPGSFVAFLRGSNELKWIMSLEDPSTEPFAQRIWDETWVIGFALELAMCMKDKKEVVGCMYIVYDYQSKIRNYLVVPGDFPHMGPVNRYFSNFMTRFIGDVPVTEAVSRAQVRRYPTRDAASGSARVWCRDSRYVDSDETWVNWDIRTERVTVPPPSFDKGQCPGPTKKSVQSTMKAKIRLFWSFAQSKHNAIMRRTSQRDLMLMCLWFAKGNWRDSPSTQKERGVPAPDLPPRVYLFQPPKSRNVRLALTGKAVFNAGQSSQCSTDGVFRLPFELNLVKQRFLSDTTVEWEDFKTPATPGPNPPNSALEDFTHRGLADLDVANWAYGHCHDPTANNNIQGEKHWKWTQITKDIVYGGTGREERFIGIQIVFRSHSRRPSSGQRGTGCRCSTAS